MYREIRFKRMVAKDTKPFAGDFKRCSIMYRPHRFGRRRGDRMGGGYPINSTYRRYRQRWRKSAQWKAKVAKEWALLKPVCVWYRFRKVMTLADIRPF